MRAFSLTGAQYYVAGFTGQAPAVAPGLDPLRYLDASYGRSTAFQEGSANFNELRAVLLRETDRYILLAGSTFVRSVEALRASSSSWCVVGLYYSAFFAAHAILGLVGCWLRHRNRWIEVLDSNPGSQRIQFQTRNHPGPNGSHRLFWHAYYSAVPGLATWVSAAAIQAFRPVSANESWFIDLRNKVNYGPAEAFVLMDDFLSHFDDTRIPACFPGELSSAYQVSRSFIDALQELAALTGIRTDLFSRHRSRELAMREYVNGSKSRALLSFSKSTRAVVEF